MFADALQLTLKLTISGTSFDIPGANVRSFSVRVHPYGFTCRAAFVVSSEDETDSLLASFTTSDLIEVNLQIAPYYMPDGVTADPLVLTGLVTEKALLLERTIDNVHLVNNPVLYRYYQVSFADPAQVLWRQHYPYDLLVEKTMKDVIDAHKGDKITITYNWDALNTQNHINALPLGVESGNGSFYDFMMWYVFTQNGVWTYDCAQNTYTLAGSKTSQGQAASLDMLDIEKHRIDFPATIRNNVNVLNAYSGSPETKAITQDQAATGIHQDYMGRYPVASDYQNRQDLETQRLKERSHEIHLTFQRFPTMSFKVGTVVNLEGGLWSDKIFPKGKVYCVRDIFIEGQGLEPELTTDHNLTFTRYNLEMESQLELQTEKWVSLPPFISPSSPMLVEGKILSEQGQDTDETYQIYQDATTSQDQYKVTIPLWTNQVVVTQFEPAYFSGHFYFPVYKNARVLVSFDLHSASIVRFLDWRAQVRLPMDSQGNALLMGQSSTNQTFMSHSLVDSKPVFSVTRTNDKDTEVIKLSEGSLLLQTQEDDSSGG